MVQRDPPPAAGAPPPLTSSAPTRKEPDRGFNGKATAEDWQGICRSMRDRFAPGEFEAGILGGIEAVSRLMATHFPAPAGGSRNEMPDRPVLL